ncbi:MAG: thiol-disulfide oxidoreductase DCC family protein [Cellvibrionaceae bacterium]
MIDTLYYDGLCPLCRKEIKLLKRLSGDNLAFKDIHRSDKTESQPSKDALLKRLHLKTSNNIWLIGLDANVHAWSKTPYGWLFKILRWPIIRQIADRVYDLWADRRYKKRYECGSCTP